MESVNILLTVSFVEQGLKCFQAVARIDLGAIISILIIKNFLITNNRVLFIVKISLFVKFQLNYETDGNDLSLTNDVFELDSAYNLTTGNREDYYYNIDKVRVNQNAKYGFLAFGNISIKKNYFTNDIQRPIGGLKHISPYNIVVTFANEKFVQCLNNTLSGSSGSSDLIRSDRWSLSIIVEVGRKNYARTICLS